MKILKHHPERLFEELQRGYAWVALLPSRKAGIPLALLTFLDPGSGFSGLFAAICAWYAGEIAGADEAERPVCVFNGLLVGLFVGHVWVAGYGTAAISLLGGIFSGWLTVVLGRLAASLVRLPVLSLPFTIVSMLTLAAGSSLSSLQANPYHAPPELFGMKADHFLAALGNLYFISNPAYGILVIAVITYFSRYYIFLAIAGYAAASIWLSFLGAAPEHLAPTAWDSNAILASILVGGLLSSPSLRTAALAVLAALFAAWLSLSFGRILDFAHLLPFSSPFVISSWIVLYAVLRNNRMSASFNLLLPDFPERSLERAQLSLARLGEAGSVALAVPFSGEWTVSQGFSGQHTHRGPWRHALDFVLLKDGLSFSGKGNRLEDFHCYNQPVYSPCYGQVWRVVNDVPDNEPGKVNMDANWGNHILLRVPGGKHVLLAHLRPWSIVPAPGSWVKPGDFIGHCGNSGRSPQPHLHLHLQEGEMIGAPTSPFHLASVLISENGKPPRYELSVVPVQSARISAAISGEVRPFHLFAGRGIRYRVSRNGEPVGDWSLFCMVDDLGRMVLVSSEGGRSVAESTWAVFSCYERNEKSDLFLDLWLLACAYSPASFQIERWEDRATPARLLPIRLAKFLACLIWPWMTFIESRHLRKWDDESQGWRQIAEHRQRHSGIGAKTEALILPQKGCTFVGAESGGNRYAMQATSLFQLADVGVPSWEEEIRMSNLPGKLQ